MVLHYQPERPRCSPLAVLASARRRLLAGYRRPSPPSPHVPGPNTEPVSWSVLEALDGRGRRGAGLAVVTVPAGVLIAAASVFDPGKVRALSPLPFGACYRTWPRISPPGKSPGPVLGGATPSLVCTLT
jgi:hypothetical protein